MSETAMESLSLYPLAFDAQRQRWRINAVMLCGMLVATDAELFCMIFTLVEFNVFAL